MITKEQAITELLACVPEFAPVLVRHRQRWAEDTPPYGLEFVALTEYVCHQIGNGQTTSLPVIFDLVEHWIANGDEPLKTAAATQFLENLLNLVPDELEPSAFVPYLGPESRKFCRAWDAFTGLATEGLTTP